MKRASVFAACIALLATAVIAAAPPSQTSASSAAASTASVVPEDVAAAAETAPPAPTAPPVAPVSPRQQRGVSRFAAPAPVSSPAASTSGLPAPRRRPSAAAQPVPPVRVAVPFGATSDQPQLLLQFELYRIRGDISGETTLTDNISEGIEEKPPKVVQTLRSPEVAKMPTAWLPGAPGDNQWDYYPATQPNPYEYQFYALDEQPPDSQRKEQELKGQVSFFTGANLTVAGVKLQAGDTGWTWDGKPKPPAGDKIEVLATPKVVLLPGLPFEITIGSQHPIQYFEQRPDGLFELRTLQEQTGLTISGAVEEGKSGLIVLRDLSIILRSIEKREPIEGVHLDVGRAIISERECQSTIAIKPGRDLGMQLTTEGFGFLILRLRVDLLSPASPPTPPAAERRR